MWSPSRGSSTCTRRPSSNEPWRPFFRSAGEMSSSISPVSCSLTRRRSQPSCGLSRAFARAKGGYFLSARTGGSCGPWKSRVSTACSTSNRGLGQRSSSCSPGSRWRRAEARPPKRQAALPTPYYRSQVLFRAVAKPTNCRQEGHAAVRLRRGHWAGRRPGLHCAARTGTGRACTYTRGGDHDRACLRSRASPAEGRGGSVHDRQPQPPRPPFRSRRAP
jgi:hypothetical protein